MSASLQAQQSGAGASFIFNGQRVEISRGDTDVARFLPRFAAPDAECAAPCIAPLQIAPGIPTLDELEVLAFLTQEVAGNAGLMVDARMPVRRTEGFIPGTVSLPFATMAANNGFRDDILRALGAREFEGVFNFADARVLLVYDTGPGASDAGVLITNLIEAGYPVDKLRYYRGGMQVWSMLGFSIAEEQQ